MRVTAGREYTVDSVREIIEGIRLPPDKEGEMNLMRIVLGGIHMELSSEEWNQILDLAVIGLERNMRRKDNESL